MQYKAIDGTLIESKPNETVSCTLTVDNHPQGIFTSYETQSASTPIGIEQIKVVRTVIGNEMTIVITESSEQELIDYVNQNKVDNAS